MNLVSCDLTSVLKFIQTITGIKGYTTRRRQETTPPFSIYKRQSVNRIRIQLDFIAIDH